MRACVHGIGDNVTNDPDRAEQLQIDRFLGNMTRNNRAQGVSNWGSLGLELGKFRVFSWGSKKDMKCAPRLSGWGTFTVRKHVLRYGKFVSTQRRLFRRLRE